MPVARGSQLSRAVAFFREGNLDEARVAFQLVREVMDARLKQAAASKQRQTTALSAPRKSRSRGPVAANAKNGQGPSGGQTTAPATQAQGQEQAAVAGA